MIGRAAAIVAAALFAGCPLAGCGEKGEPLPGDPGGTSTRELPATPGPAGYAARANALCRASDARQELIRRVDGGRQQTLRDRARLLVELAPARVKLADGLAQLEPPAAQPRTARRLVAAARARGTASTRAGRLYQRGGSRRAIASAAAAEHDERVRIVAISRRLGLAQCGEVLPAGAKRRVRAAVERGLGSPDARRRCEAFGSRYLHETYGGGVAACVESSAPGSGAADVDRVYDVTGVAGIFAEARADVTADAGTRSHRVRLAYEDGAYRIDKLD